MGFFKKLFKGDIGGIVRDAKNNFADGTLIKGTKIPGLDNLGRTAFSAVDGKLGGALSTGARSLGGRSIAERNSFLSPFTKNIPDTSQNSNLKSAALPSIVSSRVNYIIIGLVVAFFIYKKRK